MPLSSGPVVGLSGRRMERERDSVMLEFSKLKKDTAAVKERERRHRRLEKLWCFLQLCQGSYREQTHIALALWREFAAGRNAQTSGLAAERQRLVQQLNTAKRSLKAKTDEWDDFATGRDDATKEVKDLRAQNRDFRGKAKEDRQRLDALVTDQDRINRENIDLRRQLKIASEGATRSLLVKNRSQLDTLQGENDDLVLRLADAEARVPDAETRVHLLVITTLLHGGGFATAFSRWKLFSAIRMSVAPVEDENDALAFRLQEAEDEKEQMRDEMNSTVNEKDDLQSRSEKSITQRCAADKKGRESAEAGASKLRKTALDLREEVSAYKGLQDLSRRKEAALTKEVSNLREREKGHLSRLKVLQEKVDDAKRGAQNQAAKGSDQLLAPTSSARSTTPTPRKKAAAGSSSRSSTPGRASTSVASVPGLSQPDSSRAVSGSRFESGLRSGGKADQFYQLRVLFMLRQYTTVKCFAEQTKEMEADSAAAKDRADSELRKCQKEVRDVKKQLAECYKKDKHGGGLGDSAAVAAAAEKEERQASDTKELRRQLARHRETARVHEARIADLQQDAENAAGVVGRQRDQSQKESERNLSLSQLNSYLTRRYPTDKVYFMLRSAFVKKLEIGMRSLHSFSSSSKWQFPHVETGCQIGDSALVKDIYVSELRNSRRKLSTTLKDRKNEMEELSDKLGAAQGALDKASRRCSKLEGRLDEQKDKFLKVEQQDEEFRSLLGAQDEAAQVVEQSNERCSAKLVLRTLMDGSKHIRKQRLRTSWRLFTLNTYWIELAATKTAALEQCNDLQRQLSGKAGLLKTGDKCRVDDKEVIRNLKSQLNEAKEAITGLSEDKARAGQLSKEVTHLRARIKELVDRNKGVSQATARGLLPSTPERRRPAGNTPSAVSSARSSSRSNSTKRVNSVPSEITVQSAPGGQ